MSFKLENLKLCYGKKTIVSNLNLEISFNKITVFLGPNGSGKSTVLKALTKNLKPSCGHVFLNHKMIDNYKVKELAKLVSYLPQMNEQTPKLTLFSFLSLGRYPYQTYYHHLTFQDEEKINEALRLTNLENKKDELLTSFSGGELRRAYIALMLVQDTSVLILDEPTTYLDPFYQYELLQMLKRLKEIKNLTIIMVLHEINLASKFADDVVLFKEGKIISYGKKDDVLTKSNLAKLFNMEYEEITLKENTYFMVGE